MKLQSLILLRPRTANYTPEDLMLSYAREAKSEHVKAERCGAFCELRLIISGETYRFHHWQIDPFLGNVDRITIFLEKL